MVIRRTILLTVITALLTLTSGRAAGTILRENIHSASLGRNWGASIYLPEGYSSEKDAYPVLFLLHGSGGDEFEWDRAFQDLDTLISNGSIAPVVAIAPASGTSWWVDGREDFESAFFKDLVPYLYSNYRVSRDREAHIVAGFSMGGYGALRYGLAYPEIFAGSILLSPAIYDKLPPAESSAITSGSFGRPFSEERWTSQNFPAVLAEYLVQKNNVTFFIGAGDDDWNHPEGIEYNIEQQSVKLYGLLNKSHGISADLRIIDGTHNWKLWKPLFAEGLISLARTLAPFSVEKN